MIIIRKDIKHFSTALARGIAGFNKTILRKSPIKAKRLAIDKENKILTPIAKGLNKINRIKTGLKETALNPGKAVNRGIETTLEHPISATSQIAGKATMVIDPTGVGLVPLGAVGTAGEIALRKYSPKYSKITTNLSNKYRSGRGSKYVENGVNTIVNSLKYMG